MEEGEISESLQQAMNKMSSQMKILAELWPRDLSQDNLQDLQGNLNGLDGIVRELFETSSPTQIEELSDNAQETAASML